MRVSLAASLLALLVTQLGGSAAAQPEARIIYRFTEGAGILELDKEGRGHIEFEVSAEASGFVCPLPLTVEFRPEIQGPFAKWAGASIPKPWPSVSFWVPPPAFQAQTLKSKATFNAAWDLDHVPPYAQEVYVMKVRPVLSDTNGCLPPPRLIAGTPDHWRITVCQPKPGGVRSGCIAPASEDGTALERENVPGLDLTAFLAAAGAAAFLGRRR